MDVCEVSASKKSVCILKLCQETGKWLRKVYKDVRLLITLIYLEKNQNNKTIVIIM